MIRIILERTTSCMTCNWWSQFLRALRHRSVILAVSSLITVGPSSAVLGDSRGSTEAGFCATQQAYLRNMRASGLPASTCGYGPCDYPGLRDSCTAEPSEPITYIRLFFQVMCLSDGSNPTCSAEDVANQVAVVNEDYLPYRIQFRYSMRFVNSSAYRYITSFEEGRP